ncbi:S-methyl-5-thioribose-1-phosphate isomerase [Streptomyces griseofuscus]|uniref:S-methyl-5-thioribose-1-phosphate isomerase n=1 Tax=Streptomyces TaxID=1883 RepID=UPI001601D3C5|nr:S-methyl-5-thioribose-1-phosphate isomerase [Streptomyces murinus]MBA9049597.1 methylthioribose-1-phosphate isomerase [Streptomyces murinus]
MSAPPVSTGAPSGQPAATTSLAWTEDGISVVDQRALPQETLLLRLRTVDEVIDAIRTLAVRGAPAIGLAGALGVALSARLHTSPDGSVDRAAVRADAERIAGARPTAVNLAWAVSQVIEELPQGPDAVLATALRMIEEDVAANRGAATTAADLVEELLPEGPLRLLTHCNTGRLATAAGGTALGTVLELAARGRVAEVFVDETRPLLQGSRLTAWELGEAGVPYRICPDSAAAAAMAQSMVDCVLVGADRIAANGDTANKIGTYGLALAAARHGIPFIVVAPESSWDPTLADGTGIVVEERAAEEVTTVAGVRVAPEGAGVFNPAFDVTPGALITAVVSESRVLRPAGPAGADVRPGAAAGAEAEAGAALSGLSRDLYTRGWLPGTSGNLSVRMPGPEPRALITGSGLDKGSLGPGDSVLVDSGTARAVRPDGALRPSAETAIHTAVYRTTSAGAVVHAHPPYATALARLTGAAGRTAWLPLDSLELLKGLGLPEPGRTRLPVFANWPDVSRIGEEVAAYLTASPDAPPALLIADHGVTVWGRDLAQARNRLECVEAMCQLLLLTGEVPAAGRAAAA